MAKLLPAICRKQRPKEVGKFSRLKTISLLTNPCMFKKASSTRTSLDHRSSQGPGGGGGGKPVLEMAAEAVRSNRLLFEPEMTKSIPLEYSSAVPFEDCVAVEVEATDLVAEFLRSMEEVAEACGLKTLKDLEELLGWYLRVNGEKNHVFIVRAFIDFVRASPVSFLHI